ncbi:hypothetical protein RA265_27590, partial [Pseudomonas syringae pv. tagetis]
MWVVVWVWCFGGWLVGGVWLCLGLVVGCWGLWVWMFGVGAGRLGGVCVRWVLLGEGVVVCSCFPYTPSVLATAEVAARHGIKVIA